MNQAKVHLRDIYQLYPYLLTAKSCTLEISTTHIPHISTHVSSIVTVVIILVIRVSTIAHRAAQQRSTKQASTRTQRHGASSPHTSTSRPSTSHATTTHHGPSHHWPAGLLVVSASHRRAHGWAVAVARLPVRLGVVLLLRVMLLLWGISVTGGAGFPGGFAHELSEKTFLATATSVLTLVVMHRCLRLPVRRLALWWVTTLLRVVWSVVVVV